VPHLKEVEDFAKTVDGTLVKSSDILTYYVSFKMPSDITGFNSLLIVDQLSEFLEFISGNVQVGGNITGVTVTVSSSG
jgi:fimbrial isopeptide formation D2 family protein